MAVFVVSESKQFSESINEETIWLSLVKKTAGCQTVWV